MSFPVDATHHPGSENRFETEPYRILIADDAKDSQRILQAFLQEFPFYLKLVSDGDEAVEEFQSAPYDIILMDIQMPRMSGLSATRKIRSIEREQGKEPIPIIALTASSDHQDASFRAGCTAYCSKPVSQQRLVDLIAQFCQLPAAAVPGAAIPTAAPEESARAGAAEPGLPAAGAILLSPPAELRAIAPGYLASRRRELPQLEVLLAGARWDELRVSGHKMKGTGAPYGFTELTAIGAAIEKAAKAADAGAIAGELKKLADYLSRVQLAIA
jgi:CheY-like chemotaxis protein